MRGSPIWESDPHISAEEGGDVDDLTGGLAQADAALHRERAQQREGFLLARLTLAHEDALGALDELALLELRLRVQELGAQPLVGLEALDCHPHDGRQA